MHKTIKQKVENGQVILHWWEAKDGTIDNFMLSHDAPQYPRLLPGQVTGGKDKLLAILKISDEIKRLYPELAEAL